MDLGEQKKDFLTTAEIAVKLNVTQSWVRAQVFQKKIPFYKFGKKLVRFDFDEVMDWISKNNLKNGEGRK